MHSSRMRTTRSSSRAGGAPPGTPRGPGTPRTQTPPGPGTPTGPDPPVDRHTPVNILPCPKLRLRAVINFKKKRFNFSTWRR